MNIESEAVKVLAESLIKAYGSVIEQNNKTYVNNQIKNNPGSGGSGYTGSISASQIRGLGSAVLGTVSNGIQNGSISTFYDGVIRAVAAEFETAVIGTAMIDNVFARYGEFTKLVAEKAKIEEINTEEIYADLAKISTATIDSATIRAAQISISSTDNAFIRQGVGDKYYIDNLAVSESNIVNLAVGNLMINDENGNLVRIKVDSSGNVVVDEDGNAETDQYKLSGDDILNQLSVGNELISSVHGSKIIAQSVTAEQLNASEIFAKSAQIMDLIAANIDAVKLFANEGFIPNLTTTIIQSAQIGEELDISNNSSITLTNERIESVVSTTQNKTAVYVQEQEPVDPSPGDVWFNPITSDYHVAAGASGKNAPIFAYNENGELLYSYSDSATDEYDIEVNEDGELIVNDDTGATYSIINDNFKCNTFWTTIENEAFTAVSQTANKINWLIASGDSASDMTLTDEALDLITKRVNIDAEEIALKAVETLIRVDDEGLHIGEINSNKEVLIDDESLNINIGGTNYSKFASNYAQFGNYRIYNDSTGGLVFKTV